VGITVRGTLVVTMRGTVIITVGDAIEVTMGEVSTKVWLGGLSAQGGQTHPPTSS